MSEHRALGFIEEPLSVFNFGQKCEHPKDGLFLYGPFDKSATPGSLRFGAIGTANGLSRFERWSAQIRVPIAAASEKEHRSSWPGFHAAFGVDWPSKPLVSVSIDAQRLADAIRRNNRHEAVHEAVGMYESAIRRHIAEEEVRPDMWFVVIPEDVYKLCRPEISVPAGEKTASVSTISKKIAKKALRGGELFLFPEDRQSADIYEYEVNFHNQLKARLLDTQVVIQIVRETTITPNDFLNQKGELLRRVDDPATIAWNLCTTTFFKCQGKPWKLDGVRPGVCYVGLVFKKLETPTRDGNACCGAQMFLDSGDGVVFKGAVGNWYSNVTKECHLSTDRAAELMSTIVGAYVNEHGEPPKELFIHGRTRFNKEELSGFASAVPETTMLTGVRIQRSRDVKLYRSCGATPILRGTFMQISRRRAYLWTLGFIPRLKTYPGWEVPSPLEIEVTGLGGQTPDMQVVATDILGLTKLNYNACIYGDGIPVTLRFANAVGEILTAAPLRDIRTLPFRHYI